MTAPPPVEFVKISSDEELLAQSRAYRQDRGYFHVTNYRVLFTYAGSREPHFSLPYSELARVEKTSAKKGNHPPQLLLWRKGEDNPRQYEFNDEVTAWVDLRGTFKLIKKGMKPYQENRKKKELEKRKVEVAKQRADLLARDSDLRTVYEKLVPASLSEKEFWESRAELIEREQVDQKQRLGMSTAMLTDIRPSSSQSECNSHVYRLTPQVIHQIFVEYPKVRETYELQVPHKISEKEFWECYFQSNYFHRLREQNTSSRHIRRRHKENEFEAMFMGCETGLSSADVPPIVKLERIDPSVDLSKEDDTSEGFTQSLDSKMDETILMNSIPLIRRYNRHSSLVLENPEVNQVIDPTTRVTKRPSKSSLSNIIGSKRPVISHEDELNRKRLCTALREQITLDDLEGDQQMLTVPLKITDQRRYFQSDDSMDIENLADEHLEAFGNTLRGWDRPLADVMLEPSACYDVLQSITMPQSRDIEGDQKKEVTLNDEFEKRLRGDFLETNELLRHFWGTFPLTSNQKCVKAKRLEQVLSAHYDKLDDRRKEMIRSEIDQEKEYGNLLLPIVKSIGRAMAYFEEKTTLARQ